MKKIMILFIIAVLLQVGMVVYLPLDFMLMVLGWGDVAIYVISLIYFGGLALALRWLIVKMIEG